MANSVNEGNILNEGVDLSSFGQVFQDRLVKHFIEKEGYFVGVHSIVDQNMFTTYELRTIVGVMKDYVDENYCNPTYDTMEYRLSMCASNDIEREKLLATLKKIRFDTTTEDSEFIESKATKFFKRQSLIKAMNKCYKILKDDDVDKFDDCESIMHSALDIQIENEMGHDIYEFQDSALSKSHRRPIPTGGSKLDVALEGGLGTGEIGLIICPSGKGKTSFSTAIASYASTYKCEDNNYQGYKALQIFFEEDYNAISRKHFGRLSQIEARNLSKEEYINDVKELLQNHPDKDMIRRNLKLQYFKNKSKTVSDIQQFIEKLINIGFKPDVVIIDYFECLNFTKGNDSRVSEWSLQDEAYKALEAMAKELQIALWIPTQTSKDSLGGSIADGSAASGTKGKYETSSVVIALPRTSEDMKNNILTIDLMKNRGGSLGTWRGVKFNNGLSTIDMSETEDFDDSDQFKKAMEANEKKRLKQMLKEYKQKNDTEIKPNTDFDNQKNNLENFSDSNTFEPQHDNPNEAGDDSCPF